MPGVQCVICLSSDTSSDEWCVLRGCGHVFHTHCALQSLEHSRRCPQCRFDYSKAKEYSTRNGGPYQRLYFEFSDEAGSQPPPGGAQGGSGGGGADPAALAFVQGQLRDKDRRIQALSCQLTEAEAAAARAEGDLQLARAGMRDKEARLQEKIAELAREHKQVKGLANQVANLSSQLKQESARASLLALASDHTLSGSALGAEVDKLVRLGLKAPNDFWEKLVSDRSAVIMTNSNKWSREKNALERRQAELQAEVDSLKEQVAGLRRSLAAARQQQQLGGSTAASALDPPPVQQQQARPLASRHVRRFGAGGSASGPSSARAGQEPEEDPLLQSYDILDSMRLADLPQGKMLRHAQAAAAAAAAVPPATAAVEEEEDEVVLLDDSEEEQDGAFSEVESEDGQDGGQQQQQQQPQRQEQPQRQQQGAAPPPTAQHQHAAGSSLLGKRPAAAADENCGRRGAAAQLLPLAAGPGRAALQRGPGTTFIRNTAHASLGIDRGRYISSGPDGKGGVATAYQSGSAPVRMSQKQLDMGVLQHAGGAKKARGGSGGAETAAAQALRRNNALPITSFFSKAPAGRQ